MRMRTTNQSTAIQKRQTANPIGTKIVHPSSLAVVTEEEEKEEDVEEKEEEEEEEEDATSASLVFSSNPARQAKLS